MPKNINNMHYFVLEGGQYGAGPPIAVREVRKRTYFLKAKINNNRQNKKILKSNIWQIL